MRPADVRDEIEEVITRLWEIGLLTGSNPTTVRSDVGGEIWVTWATRPAEGPPIYDKPTLGEYERLIRDRQFTALLGDYSFLQLSLLFKGDVLLKHRYMFYPLPIVAVREDIETFGVSDYIQFLGTGDLTDRFLLEAPIRFDYDSAAAKVNHPASHLTVGRDTCRIPVMAPLSVGQFLGFIFRHMYPDEWATHPFLQKLAIGDHDISITDEENKQMHVAWRRRPPEPKHDRPRR